jgi:hypothetical protein
MNIVGKYGSSESEQCKVYMLCSVSVGLVETFQVSLSTKNRDVLLREQRRGYDYLSRVSERERLQFCKEGTRDNEGFEPTEREQ